MRRSLLGQLTALPIAERCDEPCARDVYDPSSVTANEATVRLLDAHDSAPCIR